MDNPLMLGEEVATAICEVLGLPIKNVTRVQLLNEVDSIASVRIDRIFTRDEFIAVAELLKKKGSERG